MFDLSATHAFRTLSDRLWDVLVIGGGIAGAGILREAARHGLTVVLVEGNDFASGASSRSSKLIHGGLHYLARGEIGIAWRASRDRNRLVATGRGLVDSIRFHVIPDAIPASSQRVARGFVGLYDRSYPGASERPTSGLRFRDAQTDDARLVLRVIREARERGGVAFNYVAARQLLRDEAGRVIGATVQERASGETAVVRARVVVNAAGVWSSRVAGVPGGAPPVRPLRGSHLVLPRFRLPLAEAVVGLHPQTERPVYALPWKDVTLVGSTAVPHDGPLEVTPRISPEEVLYLLDWVDARFPEQAIRATDIRSTFSGLRAIVSSPASGSSLRHASRCHGLRLEPGLISVAGGKLTSFHSIARSVLTVAARQLGRTITARSTPPLDPVPEPWAGLPFAPATSRRLMARYGAGGLDSIAGSVFRDRVPLRGINVLPAEIRWIVRNEQVQHLDDLMLRRLRIGLTASQGGVRWLSKIRQAIRGELGWSVARWTDEIAHYQDRWRTSYSVPWTLRDVSHPGKRSTDPGRRVGGVA